MISRVDFIIMTVVAAVLVVAAPVACVFVDAHIIAKVLWGLMAVGTIVVWWMGYGRFHDKLNRTYKLQEGNMEDAYFQAGLYFVSGIVAFVFLDKLVYTEIKAWEFFSVCYTYLGISLPVMTWRLAGKMKYEDESSEK